MNYEVDRENKPKKINKKKGMSKNDSTGDRTQNLWFRRPAPYPLGHGVLLVLHFAYLINIHIT